MVAIVDQICIKSWEITAQNGDHFKVAQGETYTTTVPSEDKPNVVVFSCFWAPVPKEHFVLKEQT